MNKNISTIIIILFCFSCGSKAKFAGEVNIHFNDHEKNKTINQQIIETRLERLKVKKFSIVELSDGFSIKIHTSDTSRVIEMLSINEKLAFWETYENSEVYPWLEKLNTQLASEMSADTTRDSVERMYPLFNKLQFNYYMGDDQQTYLSPGSIVGYAYNTDTAVLNNMLKIGFDKNMFPHKMLLMWGEVGDKGLIPLHALKTDEFTHGPFMESKDVEKSEIKKDNNLGRSVLSIKLNEDGTRIFKTFTGKNVGKQIAITFGSVVVMSPNVESEIKEGLVEVTGSSNEVLQKIEFGLKMPAYTSYPVSITHHFELRN